MKLENLKNRPALLAGVAGAMMAGCDNNGLTPEQNDILYVVSDRCEEILNGDNPTVGHIEWAFDTTGALEPRRMLWMTFSVSDEEGTCKCSYSEANVADTYTQVVPGEFAYCPTPAGIITESPEWECSYRADGEVSALHLGVLEGDVTATHHYFEDTDSGQVVMDLLPVNSEEGIETVDEAVRDLMSEFSNGLWRNIDQSKLHVPLYREGEMTREEVPPSCFMPLGMREEQAE